MNRKQPAVVLLGPTGSGKTPLGDLLEQSGLHGRTCAHFDFGANLRRIVSEASPNELVSRGDIEFLRRVLETGALLEDRDFPIAERVLDSFLQRRGVDPDALVVMNGLPRHVGQALALSNMLDVRLVIVLQCSVEVVRQRIGENTGGDRVERIDDDPDAVARKLEIYGQRTVPLVEHYREQGVCVIELDVTANMSADAMARALERRLASSDNI